MKKLCLAMALLINFVGWGQNSISKELSNIMPIRLPADEMMRRLSSVRVLFGHQSVGNNILAGVKRINQETANENLSVFSIKGNDLLTEAGIYEFLVGKNGDAKGKIDDFDAKIRSGLGNKVDIAFFKLCYVDIDAHTDIETLFSHYRNVMGGLREDYPRVRFAHITVPLVAVQTGPKAWVKKIIGRAPYGTADNLKRNKFNRMLLSTFQGKEPVFDLARIESTREDGSRETIRVKGEEVFVLVPEYTNDGGHLNEKGQRVVAAEFLRFLVEALPQ